MTFSYLSFLSLFGLIRGPAFKLKRSLSHRGFLGTLRRCTVYLVWEHTVRRRRRRHWEEEMEEFDRKFAVDTSGKVDLRDLAINSPNLEYGVSYEPTPAEIFNRMVNSLPIKYEDFTFVDFGSGKGKVLLMASKFPFKKIIGIEFSQELNRIAQQNISAYQNENQRCKKIECVFVDASEYQIISEPAVLYFYHPFGEEVMVKILMNIENSLRHHQRRIFAAYYNPVFDYLFDRMKILKKIKSTMDYSIYISVDV